MKSRASWHKSCLVEGMSKRYLIVTKRGEQSEVFSITVNSLGWKDLSKLSHRMARKLVKGEKITRITIHPIYLDDVEP